MTAGGEVSAADNDYTRLANAIACAASGQTINLDGTFDWTTPLSSAAWARDSTHAISPRISAGVTRELVLMRSA